MCLKAKFPHSLEDSKANRYFQLIALQRHLKETNGNTLHRSPLFLRSYIREKSQGR